MSLLTETIRYLNKPLWRASEFLFTPGKGWIGTASKVFGAVGMVFSAPFSIVAESLNLFSARYFPYLSYKSSAPISNEAPKIFLTFNVCMFQGGLPYLFGGQSPASHRMDGVANLIKAQNADIVCLQEMAFDPAVGLIDKIKDLYPFFYYRIGPNPFRMESALFFASKMPLEKDPQFIPFNIPGMQTGIRRGFFVAELEQCHVIATHLDPHAEQGAIRAKEIQAILDHMKTLAKKRTYLLGDFNIEAADEEARRLLRVNFFNFKEDAVAHPGHQNATCCDNMTEIVQGQTDKPTWTVFDHILCNTNLGFLQERIFTFNLENLKASLSDHYAVVLRVLRDHSPENCRQM